MESEANFSHVRMQPYLEELGLWEAVKDDYIVYPLLENPTVAQIKNQRERKTKKA